MKNNLFVSLITFCLTLFTFGCEKSHDFAPQHLDDASADARDPVSLPDFDPNYSRAFNISNNGIIVGSVRHNGVIVAFSHKNNQTWFSDEQVNGFTQPDVKFCVNEQGDVGGQKSVPGGIVPMVWLDGIGSVLEPVEGQQFGDVFDINNTGLMVGESFNGTVTAHTSTRATIFTLDGDATDIGTLGGPNAGAAAVNDAGDIVGFANTGTGESHAFLYRDGVMEDLGTLGGTVSNANAINNAGVIVGRSFLANGQIRGFIYSDGVMSEIGTLGGTTSIAHDINDAGDVVGWSTLPNGQNRAFLYRDGVMWDLGALGGNHSRALSINNQGEIVGFYVKTDGTAHGFFWRNGVMYPM